MSERYLYFKSGLRTAQLYFKSSLEWENRGLRLFLIWTSCQQLLPWIHLTEWLICHVFAVVSPLPLHPLPVVHASDPNLTPRPTTLDQIFPQQSVCIFQRLGKLCIFILAFEVWIEPTGFVWRQVVAFVTNFGKFWRTHRINPPRLSQMLNFPCMVTLLVRLLLLRLLRICGVYEEKDETD